ncbi:Uncharacterised protein [Mycobacteroides abscessus subsp. abscessus]|nr:Uncharacterised protein [Mycobacteroides abscessus subsp. abscessus]
MNRTVFPSGDKNELIARWKSGFLNTSGGRKNESSFFDASKASPIAMTSSVVSSIWANWPDMVAYMVSTEVRILCMTSII